MLGPSGGITLDAYDEMLRIVRDRGWLETRRIISAGVESGHALEIGMGPGYTGLQWLRETVGTRLTGVDVVPELVEMAEALAGSYGLSARADYLQADARVLPFADAVFDGVFASYSLHEWPDAEQILAEVVRVLRPGGVVALVDFDRAAFAPKVWFMWLRTRPRVMRRGLYPSVGSAYIAAEARDMLAAAGLREVAVTRFWRGLVARGAKPVG